MKTLLCIIFIALSFLVQGQYLSPIIDPAVEGQYVGGAVMTDTKLIYETEKDEVTYLWSMDLTSKLKQPFFSTSHFYGVRQVGLFQGWVYFLVNNENNEPHLWRTDGTQNNTSQISTEPLGGSTGRYTIRSNQLFTTNQQGQLQQLSGDRLINRPITVESINLMCVFDADHLIVQTKSLNPETYHLMRLQNGLVTEVHQYQAINNFQTSATTFKSDCYIRYLDESDGLTIMQIPINGAAQPFQAPTDIPEAKRVFSHQDRLYVIAGEGYISNQMYRLTPDLQSYDAFAELSEFYSFGTPGSYNDKLVSVATQNRLEPFSIYVVLDNDLNIIPHRYNYFQSAYGGPAILGSNLLLGTSALNDDDVVLEWFKPDDGLEIISIKDHFLSQIIGNTEQFYLDMSSDDLRIRNLFALTDQPTIGPSISGAWIEPNIDNQGLLAQHGQRSDGSQYVFTTLYVFDQGQPLWLAGSSELKTEQRKISLDLYRYDGLELLETDAQPNRTSFGQLQLEMSDCDQLTATIISTDHNLTWSLDRVDDASFKRLCANIVPLSLQQSNALSTEMGVPHD